MVENEEIKQLLKEVLEELKKLNSKVSPVEIYNPGRDNY
jgi:hypothetical protein